MVASLTFQMRLVVLYLSGLCVCALRSKVQTSSSLESASSHSFAGYKARYGRAYADRSDEHMMREKIFNDRLSEIKAHNARGLSWKKGVNHLTDRTPEELNMLNGHRPALKATSHEATSFLEASADDTSCSSHNQTCTDSSCCSGFTCGVDGNCVPIRNASSFDWSSQLSTAHKIVEQGSCGSCWAMAATAVLNAHAEIVTRFAFKNVLSPQNILSCTPNKLECGGQGGCKGATAEVAYDWLKSVGAGGGVHTVDDQPYHATDDSCPMKASSIPQAMQPPAVSIKGWKVVKDNDAQVLMDTLVTVGPLVTSIAANGLFSYSTGVIDGCSDNVVNHAVVLMGFGFDQGSELHYWNVRNSWGATWGEDGFFRLKRAAPGSEEPCSWDEKPEEGVVCKDKVNGKYPKRQWVCGECAFLTDTAYPIGTHVPTEMLDGKGAAKESDGTQQRVANSGDAPVKDNAWCKTQCQHFGMQVLAKTFAGADFGSDPTTCTQKCDKFVPIRSAE